MERILIVDDDPVLQRALERLFESDGYSVEVVGDGRSALEAFRRDCPTAIVLDLGLPIMRGQDVCRAIRQESPTVPIVILSAMTDILDKVLLLEMGADDYVTKPFSPRELLARVWVAHRQPVVTHHRTKTRFDGVCIDFISMDATLDDKPVALTPLDFKVLEFLVQNADRAVSRRELATRVLGYHPQSSSRGIDDHICRLRQKLERDPTNPNHFLTVRQVGYKFVW